MTHAKSYINRRKELDDSEEQTLKGFSNPKSATLRRNKIDFWKRIMLDDKGSKIQSILFHHLC